MHWIMAPMKNVYFKLIMNYPNGLIFELLLRKGCNIQLGIVSSVHEFW